MQRLETEHGLIRAVPAPGWYHGRERPRHARYAWDVGGGAMAGGRGGDVRTLKRARASVSSASRRMAAGQNLYSGQKP